MRYTPKPRRKRAQFVGLVLFIIMGAYGLKSLALSLDFLSPFQKAIENFDVSDYAFKDFKQSSSVYIESNVVLVNFGKLDRAGIAQLIDSLSAYHPKVIGLDALFYQPKDPNADFKLYQALKNAGNVILANKLDSLLPDGSHGHIHEPYALFKNASQSAFANVITGLDDGFRTCRKITIDERVHDSVVYSFPAEILRAFNSEKFERLESRNEETEVINWLGNVSQFSRLNYSDVMQGGASLDFIKDKIVVVGYLGPGLGEVLDFEDAFFTPLNKNPVGRAFPDMYGPVIHANALSMMLNERYIDGVHPFWAYFLGAGFMLFNAFFFQRVMWARPNAFELLSRVVQVVQLVFMWALAIYLLAVKSIKLDISLALFAIVLSADFTDIYESSIAPRLKRFLDYLIGRKLA